MTLADHHLSTPLLPSLGMLSEGQVRGLDCTFCGVSLSSTEAVDLEARDILRLGEPGPWSPRACRPCADGGCVDRLLVSSFSACRDLPPTDQLLDLYLRLRHEVRRRLPAVEQAARIAGRGTLTWHAHQRIVDAANDALNDMADDDPSLWALALRCSELGRRLRDLIPYPACGERC